MLHMCQTNLRIRQCTNCSVWDNSLKISCTQHKCRKSQKLEMIHNTVASWLPDPKFRVTRFHLLFLLSVFPLWGCDQLTFDNHKYRSILFFIYINRFFFHHMNGIYFTSLVEEFPEQNPIDSGTVLQTKFRLLRTAYTLRHVNAKFTHVNGHWKVYNF